VRLGLKFALIGAFLAAAGTAAGQQPAAQSRDVTKAVRPAPVQSTSGPTQQAVPSIIDGLALSATNTPLPHVTVHLRNLETKQIEQRSLTNDRGEFVFVVKPNVPYVVEIAGQAGRIFAASDVITTQLGEVAGAVVTLPGPIPALAGIFRDTASSVLSAATGTGMTAVTATPLPVVSPEK
jgi:hypothetical protein